MKQKFIFEIAMAIASLAAAILVVMSIYKNWGGIFVIDLLLLPIDIFLMGLWASSAVKRYRAMEQEKVQPVTPVSDSSIEEALKGDMEAVEKDIKKATGLYTQSSFGQEAE